MIGNFLKLTILFLRKVVSRLCDGYFLSRDLMFMLMMEPNEVFSTRSSYKGDSSYTPLHRSNYWKILKLRQVFYL